MRVDYYEYINSPEWRRRANAAKALAGYRCRVCNRHADEVVLNAHHRTYERLGNEDPDDITVLCRNCHELYELNGRPPKKPQQVAKPKVVQPYTLPLPERPAVKSTSTLGSSSPVTLTASVLSKVPAATVAAKPSTMPVTTVQKKPNLLGAILGFIIITAGLIAAIPVSSRFVAFIIGAPVPTSTYTATAMPTFTLTPASTIANNVPTATPQASEIVSISTYETWTNPVDNAVYVYISPGEFLMGSAEQDQDAWINEMPQHSVNIDAFWIMQTEVTNKQYGLCVGAGVCTEPDLTGWNDGMYAEHPVVNVDWEQANTYAKWAGGRLPTEAEWEKACRGTDSRIYTWGNQTATEYLLNYDYNSGDTRPVRSYPPGAYNLYDMAGNVWEWTADWYEEEYYLTSPSSNPKGPENGKFRTPRGGSWESSASTVRCASRPGHGPYSTYSIGFRIVLPNETEPQ